jgi:hypothetical protein
MPLERDHDAERIARLDLIVAEAQRAISVPLDEAVRKALRQRLDNNLKELGAFVQLRAPSISSAAVVATRAARYSAE